MILLAAALAVIAGFALQRGSICAVKAVREGVVARDWRGFVALLECSAWALLGLLGAAGFGLIQLHGWPTQPSIFLALLGGAIFGAGALINGACALGTVGRLAAGEAAFLAMPVGFVLGALGARELGARTEHAAAFAFAGPALVLILAALTGLGLYRMWLAWRAAPNGAAIVSHLAAPHWPPALAMAITALANVGLFALVYSWPYTTLLVDVASGMNMDTLARAALALALVLGAGLGAASAGRFAWRAPTRAALAECFAGGALMGAGGALIPGGNDALILIGLPLLQPAAFAAYAAMVAAIALGFSARRRLGAEPAQP